MTVDDETLREHTRIVMKAYDKIQAKQRRIKKAKRKQAKASRRRNNG